MRRLAVLMLVGAAVAAVVMRGKRHSAEPRPSMWEKMRQHMEDMPEDFPPRVMFDNVAATRENTERLLEILERDASVTKPKGDEEGG